jgi:uncharacterized protein
LRRKRGLTVSEHTSEGLDRREFLALGASAAAAASCAKAAFAAGPCGTVDFIDVPVDVVPRPKDVAFEVAFRDGRRLTLRAHYWYHAPAMRAGKRLPAIVDFNPYRRRDGMLYVDTMMYPWFSYNEYLCFRVDLQGSGDSDGVITDEYTEDELASCVQVIEQIAALPFCDGNVGMMGKSWSAINSLMVAARDDCPAALKAIVFCCGTDDRFNDDVHYMGGAMMYDQPSWAGSMFGWLPMPPDPLVVGERWREMWRERVRALDFWFAAWAAHQTRDEYWRRTSVRDHYERVKVPVFVISGWWDGYKNPAERALRILGGMGKPVAGILGPWGHKYPFDGYPGPRVDWLRYVIPHWWDRWLKGKAPDESSAWPQLAVWLGESREPSRIPDYVERGTWVAEDHAWPERVRPHALHCGPAMTLSAGPMPQHQAYRLSSEVLTGTAMLESTSWGECENDDLPRDMRADDRRSLYFDTPPLEGDLACFGYPEVTLDLECSSRGPAAVAVRLCEVSPSGRSHLVTYRFWSLGYLDGELGAPQAVPRGRFAVTLPLNVMGHTFKRGWKIRLAVSPAWVPTMWRAVKLAEITLHAGGDARSALRLPGRPARPEDARIEAALGRPVTAHVNPELYAPIEATRRDAVNRRTAAAVEIDGKPGVAVHKLMDAGSYVYGGMLEHLLVDSSATEEFRTAAGDPVTAEMTTRYESRLARGSWSVRAVTTTRVWSEPTPAGGSEFRYTAEVETFEGEQPFERRRVAGSIPRIWV